MPNAKYDQTSTIMTGTDWVGGRTVAFLMTGATFDPTQKNLGEVKAAGGTQVAVTEIRNKAIGPNNEALGLPAVFSIVPEGSDYQVILTWDQMQPEVALIGFYDENGDGGGPIDMTHNGTLIVRPEDPDPTTGLGPWFTF